MRREASGKNSTACPYGNHGYIIASFPGLSSHRNEESRRGTKISHIWTWCDKNLILTNRNKTSRLQNLQVAYDISNFKILAGTWNELNKHLQIFFLIIAKPEFMLISLLSSQTVPNLNAPAWKMASGMTKMQKSVILSICAYSISCDAGFSIQGLAPIKVYLKSEIH